MKVWTVEGQDYEDQKVRSVWSSLELAESELERYLAKDPYAHVGVDMRGYEVDPKESAS